MATNSLRSVYKQALLRRLFQAARPLELRSTVVFAPHQDDETLGCGGTIFLERQAGIPVELVFVTDGARSHQRFIAPEALKALRAAEARRAGQVLGVPEEHIRFLDFPNGALKDHQAEAQRQAASLLEAFQPQQVFVPCAGDFHQEHRLTNLIVLAALRDLLRRQALVAPVRLLEYPIWFWYQLPWVGLPAQDAKERQKILQRSLRYGLGVAFLNLFQQAVNIQEVLPVKQAALAAYTSQTARMANDPGWPTLSDVAGGEFQNLFFQPYEVFHQILL